MSNRSGTDYMLTRGHGGARASCFTRGQFYFGGIRCVCRCTTNPSMPALLCPSKMAKWREDKSKRGWGWAIATTISKAYRLSSVSGSQAGGSDGRINAPHFLRDDYYIGLESLGPEVRCCQTT